MLEKHRSILGIIIVQVGDRVVALPDHRAWAELVPVPAKYVYQVPETMPLQVRLWRNLMNGFRTPVSWRLVRCHICHAKYMNFFFCVCVWWVPKILKC